MIFDFFDTITDSDEDTDPDHDEWENQQIRKGVTGAQLVSAQQQEAVYSQYMLRRSADRSPSPLSTKQLLEQAYADSALERPRRLLSGNKKSSEEPQEPRKPAETLQAIRQRIAQVRELHEQHKNEINRITRDIQMMKMEELECEQKAPLAEARFRFFQEFRIFVNDLVECFDEKVPKIVDLERRTIACISKQATTLIERRRQDVRDQGKEMAQIGSEY